MQLNLNLLQFLLVHQTSMEQEMPENSIFKRFDLKDQTLWIQELMDKGCVVIKSIIDQKEVKNVQDMFWEWLEHLGSGIKRQNPSTWQNDAWPGLNDMGFFVSYGGCHTKASWHLRTHPNVQQAFAKLWKTNQLITSFDTFISWRPWWLKQSKHDWSPYVQNLHCDQNPFYKKGFKCVQGMIPLKRVRKDQCGGLMVVPSTNNDKTQQQLIQRYPGTTYSQSDWLQLSNKDPFIGKGSLVQCQAGDLILWDSRSIHGGKINQPSEQFKKANSKDLVRLAMTVTMIPRQWASADIIQKRKKAFEKRIGLTHWPNEYIVSGMAKMAKQIERQKITYVFPQLTEQIARLI